MNPPTEKQLAYIASLKRRLSGVRYPEKLQQEPTSSLEASRLIERLKLLVEIADLKTLLIDVKLPDAMNRFPETIGEAQRMIEALKKLAVQHGRRHGPTGRLSGKSQRVTPLGSDRIRRPPPGKELPIPFEVEQEDED